MQHVPSDHCYLQTKPLFCALVVLLKIGPQLQITFPEEIMEWIGISVVKHSQPESVKMKVRGHKLRNILHWQGGH
jgi:hypothetical protein